jgi:hypothetical protein
MHPASLRGHVAFLGLVLTAAIGACGSAEEDKKEAAENAEAAAKESFLSDYCAIVSECCNRVLSVPKSDPTCKKRIADVDPKMLADAKARTDCLAQLRKVTGQSDFCTEFGNFEQPACPDARRKELAGSKKPGEACAAPAECAPSFEGVVTCKGVCQVTKRGKEGDGPCVATVDGDVETRLKGDASGPDAFVCFLRDELVCDPSSKKCIKPIASNGKCSDTAACVPTAYCNDETKTCTTRKSSGSSCSGDDECQGECVDGFCETSSKEGGKCASNGGCGKDLACSGGKCVKPQQDVRLAAACVSKQ